MKSKLNMVISMIILVLLAVACTGGAKATPTAAPATPAPTSVSGETKIVIANFAFDPATVTVPVGTTVQWTNNDGATHTITSDAGDWDSGRLSNGQSFSHTFTEAGSFGYHCSIHRSMKGTIVVTP